MHHGCVAPGTTEMINLLRRIATNLDHFLFGRSGGYSEHDGMPILAARRTDRF